MRNMKKILAFFVILGLIVPFLPLNIKADTNLPDIDIMVFYILDDDNMLPGMFFTQPYGSTITPIPAPQAGYTFKYWIVNGIPRVDLAEDNTFYVTSSNMMIYGVYSPNDPVVEYSVLFIDSNGSFLDIGYYYFGDTAVPPVELPDKPGLQISDPAWKNIATGSTDLTINDDSIYQLQYESISVDNYDLNLDGSLQGSYAYNEVVTLVADPSDGIDPFSHWEENGIVVSRNLEYSFTMIYDRNLTKVYSDTPQNDDAIVTSTEDLAIREDYQTYMGQFYVPDGYDIVEYGFLIDDDNTINLTLNTPDVTIAKANNYNPDTNEFMMSFELWSHLNARAYLVYDTGTTLVDIYSEVENLHVIDIVYETGFEDEDGFTASSTYNNTSLNIEGEEPNTWSFYYGTPSTTDALYDAQSAQMRYYLGSPLNLGYLQSNFKVSPAAIISFFGLVTDENDVAVSISTDKEIWTDPELMQLTDAIRYREYQVNSEEDVYVRFTLMIPETPVDASKLYIDNLVISELYSGPSHLVTFNDEGDENVVRFKDNGTINDNLSPTKEGYTFDGWFTDDETFVNEFVLNSDPVTQDMTLYAKYVVNQYTINFDSNGGSTVDPITDDYNVVVDRPADPTKDGYTFNNWYVEFQLLHLAEDFDGFKIDSEDKTLYAKWDLATYNVTYDLDGGTNHPSNPATYTINSSTIILENPTKVGYTFDGWFLEDTFVNQIGSIDKGSFGDLDLFAKFTEIVGTYYTVSFDTNEGSSILDQSVPEDGFASEPNNPTKDGSLFDGWFTDNVTFANEFDFDNDAITTDITLYAKWLEWTIDDFSDYPGASSGVYSSGNYTSGITGITWTYTNARGDVQIDDEAITLQDSSASLEGIIPNGISSFRIELLKPFSTDSGIELYINDVLIATSEKSTGDIVIFEVFDIDITGSFTIKLVPTDAQTAIDNLSWIPYGPVTGYSPVIENTPDATITEGDTYDPLTGVTSSDFEDGDLTSSVSYVVRDDLDDIVPSPVDFSSLTPGSYSITYSVTDSNSNTEEVLISLTVNSSDTVYATDLFFSEYGEGSSDNKWIEIYNGTGSQVNLSNYSIELYANGASSPTSTENSLTATIAHGEVYVLYNNSAVAAVKVTNGESSTVINFNGDDTILLKHNETIIDSFGQVGFDPGTKWSENTVQTQDRTLVRKPEIISGDLNPTNIFDPSLEWMSNPQDTFTFIGSHTMVGE